MGGNDIAYGVSRFGDAFLNAFMRGQQMQEHKKRLAQEDSWREREMGMRQQQIDAQTDASQLKNYTREFGPKPMPSAYHSGTVDSGDERLGGVAGPALAEQIRREQQRRVSPHQAFHQWTPSLGAPVSRPMSDPNMGPPAPRPYTDTELSAAVHDPLGSQIMASRNAAAAPQELHALLKAIPSGTRAGAAQAKIGGALQGLAPAAQKEAHASGLVGSSLAQMQQNAAREAQRHAISTAASKASVTAAARSRQKQSDSDAMHATELYEQGKGPKPERPFYRPQGSMSLADRVMLKQMGFGMNMAGKAAGAEAAFGDPTPFRELEGDWRGQVNSVLRTGGDTRGVQGEAAMGPTAGPSGNQASQTAKLTPSPVIPQAPVVVRPGENKAAPAVTKQIEGNSVVHRANEIMDQHPGISEEEAIRMAREEMATPD